MVPIFQVLSNVMMSADPALSMIAVSCANGKLLTLGVPPDDVAHAVADQFWSPARFQYTVLGEGNVMPELPPQLPALVGDEPAAEPAITMSRKSQSLTDNVLTVSVLGVPGKLLARNTL